MGDRIPARDLVLSVYTEAGVGRSWPWPLFFSATVEQTKSKRPNKGAVEVFNLSDESADWIATSGYLLAVLANSAVLYRGEIKKVRSAWKAPDKTTAIECGDGVRAFRDATLSRSWTPGTTSATVLRDLLLVTGQASRVIGTIPEQVYESGHAVAGRVSDALADVVESLGCELSTQDGTVQILAPGAPKSGGPLLKSGSGLIGSPERKDKGLISCSCLLRPELRPGGLFRLESRLITGWFRATKTTHAASSDGQKWQTDVEAKEP